MFKTVVARCPLRVSLFGGGTDIPENYPYGGEVISMAIDKYVYVMVKETNFGSIRLHYGNKVEEVSAEYPDQITHDLFRAILCDNPGLIGDGLEIHNIADLSLPGCGLGSSSAVMCAALSALRELRNVKEPQESVPSVVYRLENRFLGRHSGWQDSYGCFYGGLKHIGYSKYPTRDYTEAGLQSINDDVTVTILSQYKVRDLIWSLMLFDTGKRRNAPDILEKQTKNARSQRDNLHKMITYVHDFVDITTWIEDEDDDIVQLVGKWLHECWMLKKEFADGVSNSNIDEMYAGALDAGAIGGKLLGAGGGGFILFVVPITRHYFVEKRMESLGAVYVPFEIDYNGVNINVITCNGLLH